MALFPGDKRPKRNPEGSRIAVRAVLIVLAGAAILLAGCIAKPHQTALRQYRAGELAEAEATMGPLLEKKSNNEMIYLWDLGMIRFARGNYLGANELWMRSDLLAAYEPGAAETGFSFLSSDASKNYLGDPVEHSFASLYVGLGYYMTGDLTNAMVAFRKSLEWDFNKDPELQGNMVITNHMMGECYSRLGESDNAVVGYRRALKENPDFVPAYVGVIRELEKMNNLDEAARFREELSARTPPGYLEAIDETPQGVLAIIMSGYAPVVKEVGEAFRKRESVNQPAHGWMLSAGRVYSRIPTDHPSGFNPDSTLMASLADRSLDHFSDQGGEVGQLTRKALQSALSAVTTELFGIGTDTSADTRYWSTIPGEVFAMYLPLEPGLHTIHAYAYNDHGHQLDAYRQWWHYIPVRDKSTTALVIISNEYFNDPGKPKRVGTAAACCDAIGHNPANVPYILGGNCFCTPSRRLVDAMHAAAVHPETDYRALKKLYDQAGIATCHDHRGCNNLCKQGPHVAFGGKCMATPTPGTGNYERVLSWTPTVADSVQTSQATKEGDE